MTRSTLRGLVGVIAAALLCVALAIGLTPITFAGRDCGSPLMSREPVTTSLADACEERRSDRMPIMIGFAIVGVALGGWWLQHRASAQQPDPRDLPDTTER